MTKIEIELDGTLLEAAMAATGARSEREAIEIALREIVRRHRLADLVRHAGKVPLASSVEGLLEGREMG